MQQWVIIWHQLIDIAQCFLTLCDWVYPCHRLLHSHSPCCEYMADATVIIAIECSSLDNDIYPTFFIACFPPCSKLATVFRYDMIWSQTELHKMYFICFSTHALFEKRKGEFFCLQRCLQLMNGGNFTICIHIVQLLEKLQGLVLINAFLFCVWLCNFEWTKIWLLYLKTCIE